MNYINAMVLILQSNTMPLPATPPPPVVPLAIPHYASTGLGEGQLTCREWLASSQNDDATAHFQAWLRGYMSAVAEFRAPALRMPVDMRTVAQMTEQIDRVCRDNRGWTVSFAVGQALDDIAARQHRGG